VLGAIVFGFSASLRWYDTRDLATAQNLAEARRSERSRTRGCIARSSER